MTEPTDVETWQARMHGHQPAHIEAVADALVTMTTSRPQARMIAWSLDDEGLLARPGRSGFSGG